MGHGLDQLLINVAIVFIYNLYLIDIDYNIWLT